MSHNLDELTQAYFHQVYQGSWAQQRQAKEQTEQQKELICSIYGELHYYSVQKILRRLKLTERDIILDLGSGLGKFVLQAFMQSSARKVIGIEAMPEMHDKAKQVIRDFKADYNYFWEGKRELILLNENFLYADWQKANIVYTCSTCFTQELINEIGRKVNESPHVLEVLSFRPIPTLKMPLRAVYGVECSWDSTLCYHYGVSSF